MSHIRGTALGAICVNSSSARQKPGLKTPEMKERRFKTRVKWKCKKQAMLMPTALALCGMKHGSEAGRGRIEQSCSETTLGDASTHIDDLP